MTDFPMTFATAIYDANPTEFGLPGWPMVEPIRARRVDTAIARLAREARRRARACGEYERGMALWVRVWAPDGNTWTREIRI